MCETSIAVWFVCKLCRGSFGQVDAFIEHKKQKHFTAFQNTTCIVFEESEHTLLHSVVTSNEDHQFADESIEPPIKIEVNDEDHFIPFSSEIIDEPHLDLVEPKSELAYETEIIPDSENNFFGLEQKEQNPYVLLERLTSDEIERACVLNHHSTRLKCGQKILLNDLESPDSFDSNSKIIGQNEAEKPTETPPIATLTISTEDDLQFECKLCSKQLQSEAQLKIRVGICALYHEDRNRFCVTCNRKFSKTDTLKDHRLTFHGTEEEKLSLYKFKCHVCSKQYKRAADLRFHLETHKNKTQQVTVTTSKSKSHYKCSYPNCGKECRDNYDLQKHMAIHSNLRPFRCSLPNCNKKFTQETYMKKHSVIHTGQRPYKCTVDNCNKTYIFSSDRSRHYRIAHRN